MYTWWPNGKNDEGFQYNIFNWFSFKGHSCRKCLVVLLRAILKVVLLYADPNQLHSQPADYFQSFLCLQKGLTSPMTSVKDEGWNEMLIASPFVTE